TRSANLEELQEKIVSNSITPDLITIVMDTFYTQI
ncbi:hypothetical protein EAI_14410, partial [Harpegnathos saltator]